MVCSGLVAADFFLKEEPRLIALQEQVEISEPAIPVALPSSAASMPAMSSSEPSFMLPVSSSSSEMNSEVSSSVPSVVKKGVSTKKASGINVENVFTTLQLVLQPTGEASFLLLTAPDKSQVKTSILLRNNDRAFLVSWLESSDVKAIFAGLKQALQEQFSSKVTDLIDETRTPENGPPVDYLSFIDPVLSPERIVFLRVRSRLFELHIAKNGDDIQEALVSELSR